MTHKGERKLKKENEKLVDHFTDTILHAYVLNTFTHKLSRCLNRKK